MHSNNSSPSSPQSSYNSSYGSNSGRKLINSSDNSITALVPGGVVTTQNISTVIKPKSNNNSLQFVKIQTPELSKKAVEQIKLAEDSKISKDKIKEVEEEWQNNLLNWKSKRRQQITQTFEQAPDDSLNGSDPSGGRKIKTFAEMIEQRAKSGNRLGYHLQRYLGAEDEEEGPVVVSEDTKDLKDESDHLKNPVDSDYEAHSSTSSGYNQLDSKSPSFPDTSLDVPDSTETAKDSIIHTSRCDSELSKTRQEEKDNHSISLVESSHSNQLNSTLIEGVKPPVQTKVHTERTKPMLEVSTKTNEDESDNSGFEEDEEEEEQKHLQRIAFEAKLKAFEKLAKPTTPQRSQLAPKRITAQNKSIGVDSNFNELRIHEKSSNSDWLNTSDQSIPKVQNSNSNQSNISSTRINPNSPKVNPCITQANLSLTRVESSLNQAKMDPTPTNLTQLNANLTQVSPNLNQVNQNLSQVSPNLNQDSPNLNQVSPDLNQGNQNLSQVSPNSNQVSQNLNQLNLNLTQVKPILNHVNPSLTQINLTPTLVNSNLNQIDSSSTKINLSSTKSNISSIPANISHQELRNEIPSKPLPETPKSTQNQKKSIRDDKDRTVLSVSGKKRCSSCKEELGRGAAAFVVESLSLVYHTNCFRCSVCHMNLSNGFRGVDVRVHAGALHCQNCYSKDGLNYSRV